jgi:hypothetical protein
MLFHFGYLMCTTKVKLSSGRPKVLLQATAGLQLNIGFCNNVGLTVKVCICFSSLAFVVG